MGRRSSGGRPVNSRGDPPAQEARRTRRRPAAPRNGPGRSPRAWDRLRLAAVCGLLLLAVGLVFAQTAGFDFVNYDDPESITKNRLVTGELSLRRLEAVFTGRHIESWAPLTCLSHVLVWHLLGHGPAVHHLVNVALHAASTLILLVVLWRATGRLWPAALVAAIFAAHPLRAESVAWATERKDVLSGFFFMLTLAAYVDYARHRFSLGRCLTVLACFALSLAAKPMAVTLPALLLLLDYWPLGRFSPQNGSADPTLARRASEGPGKGREEGAERRGVRTAGRDDAPRTAHPHLLRLLWEKVPLVVIAGLFCLLAVHGQGTAGLEPNRHYSLAWRIGNAAISCAVYAVQFIYPRGLIPSYPRRPLLLPSWQIAAAIVALCAITAGAIHWRRRRPHLLVGWLWYLGMLVPVIGLVQFGGQAEADRFTYLPQIGLCIALVWAASRVRFTHPPNRPFAALVTACALAILVVAGWRQASYWRDSETLWTHALACDPQNLVAHVDLGNALNARRRVDEAIAHYQKAVQLAREAAATRGDVSPTLAEACNNLGAVLSKRGQLDTAMELYREALGLNPGDADAHYNLGMALAGKGQTNEAIAQFEKALKRKPDLAEAHFTLATLLVSAGRPDQAILHYRQALELDPAFVAAHCGLAAVLADGGRLDEAIAHYRQALKLKPDHAWAMNNLAWLRATTPEASLRNAKEAIELAEQASRLAGGNAPDVLDTLAAAYAEAGRFAEAKQIVRRALALAEKQKDTAMVEILQARLRLYEASRRVRETHRGSPKGARDAKWPPPNAPIRRSAACGAFQAPCEPDDWQRPDGIIG